MEGAQGYIFDDRETEVEFARLDEQAQLLDEFSRSRIAGLSLGDNVRCLEVGPGTGSMSRWMADKGWTVVALDISDRWFPAMRRERVELQVGDIRTAEVTGPFDLIFIRYVLHHLPERADVVKKLARQLSPAGWLVAEEPERDLMRTLAGPDVMAFFREALGHFADYGVDYNCGASLPSLLSDAGLVDIDSSGGFPLVFPCSPNVSYLTRALDAIEQRLVPLGLYTTDEFDRRREEASRGFLGTGAVNISCRGRRAA